MTPFPLTIAIPTRNRADLMINTLRRCMNQTRPLLEVIVSDNASEDDTLSRLEEFSAYPNLRILRQDTNLGMVGNWNACLQEAHGEWFLLLSDDDEVASDFVAHVERALAGTSGVDLLIMRCPAVNRMTGETDENVLLGVDSGVISSFRTLFPAWLASRFNAHLSGIIFRRATLIDRGGFDNALTFAADAATWIPIAARGKVAYWPEARVRYIQHELMLTRSFPVATVVADMIHLVGLVSDAIRQRDDLTMSSRLELQSLMDFKIYDGFNTQMIQGARSGVSKIELFRIWLQVGPRLRWFGIGPLSIGAVLVPCGLIGVIGWPYRKIVRTWRRCRAFQRH